MRVVYHVSWCGFGLVVIITDRVSLFLDKLGDVVDVSEVTYFIVENDIEHVDLHNLLRVYFWLVLIWLVNDELVTFVSFLAFLLLFDSMPNDRFS